MRERRLVTTALAAGAVALAAASLAVASTRIQASSSAATVVNVTVLEGKLKIAPTLKLSATTLPAGLITLVVVNKGKTSHGLAIMGSRFPPKRTPTLAVGKTARITVTLKAGIYHLWDPVQSSMNRAKMLTVNAVKTSSSGSSGGSFGGSGYTPPPSGSSTGGSDSTWTTCIDPVTGEDHGPMDHPCDF